jgi:glycosyltransferase involved in cell wall biosynthesis
MHFLGHRNDVPQLLPDADVFALATRVDSIPTAALEAMVAGVPVVITDVPGSDALLRSATSEPLGWVVPREAANAFAAALHQAISPEGKARAARARAVVRREHTPAALASGLESLLAALPPRARAR